MEYRSISYAVDGRIATITLDRPDRLNAIDEHMPGELAAAVDRAEADDDIHVIVVTGAGRAFSSGYDLHEYAEAADAAYSQEMPWDPMVDFRTMHANTRHFMRLFECDKPTVAEVRGFAVAGGSDIALCCDLVVMADDARIGYPPARVWGCPTTAMWVYRVGPERAKRMLFTGDLVTGREAADMGLILEAVPEEELSSRVRRLADRMAGVPRNQLMMQKLMATRRCTTWASPPHRSQPHSSMASPATHLRASGSSAGPKRWGSRRQCENVTRAPPSPGGSPGGCPAGPDPSDRCNRTGRDGVLSDDGRP